jgi:hypothetical protein
MVLAGTLRCFTAHFRLRMEMIRVADGVQIWVEDLLIARHSIAGIESDLVNRIDFQLKSRPFVAKALAAPPAKSSSEKKGEGVPPRQLSAQCSPSDPEAVRSARTPSAETANVNAVNASSTEAFETFLRGRHEWQSRERDRVQERLQQLIPDRQT